MRKESTFMPKKLIIYGVGKLAEYVAYLFENDSDYSVQGYCIEKEYLHKMEGKIPPNFTPIISFEDLEKKWPANTSLFIAVGNNKKRAEIFDKAMARKINFGSYISSKTIHWNDLIIGSNVFISEASAISPFVKIGDNSIIIGTKIGHHCTIGKNVLVSGCMIGGDAKIGDHSFLGLNSAIGHGVKIGNNNIIGMNTSITRNTSANSIYMNEGTVLKKVDATKISHRTLM